MANTAHSPDIYYVPHGSYWPMVGSIALFLLLGGVAASLGSSTGGIYAIYAGSALLLVMLFGWFGDVIRENQQGQYNLQVDRTFRWAMMWFIFSEVMFFAVFFGSLFHSRVLTIEWLGGMGHGALTHEFLWPTFEAIWPHNGNGPAAMGGEFNHMGPWGLPAINTLILLTSGVTITYAHHALKADNRKGLIWGLFLTVALGFIFVALQAEEYIHAYTELNLTLNSGIYGSTFFMLTGFHGLHVTLGAIMLTVVLIRALVGHFTSDRHFAFEAAAWYWHFVDVVWLGLFVFVYWL